jgi:putative membrane protein
MTPAQNEPMQTPSGPAQSSAKKNDQQFVHEAALGGLMEVEVGKLAQQKSSSDAVKQFGQRLVQDHTKANDQLKEVAAKQGLSVPDTLDSKHQATVDKLSKLSGKAFDQAFIKDAVKDHEEDVKKFQKEAQNGKNPGVKNFASETIPVLQEHLSMAKSLKKSNGASVGSASQQ